MEGKIFVVGGFNDPHAHGSVEYLRRRDGFRSRL